MRYRAGRKAVKFMRDLQAGRARCMLLSGRSVRRAQKEALRAFSASGEAWVQETSFDTTLQKEGSHLSAELSAPAKAVCDLIYEWTASVKTGLGFLDLQFSRGIYRFHVLSMVEGSGGC